MTPRFRLAFGPAFDDEMMFAGQLFQGFRVGGLDFQFFGHDEVTDQRREAHGLPRVIANVILPIEQRPRTGLHLVQILVEFAADGFHRVADLRPSIGRAGLAHAVLLVKRFKRKKAEK